MAVVIIPILYVVFFGEVANFVLGSFSIQIFEDITIGIFLWVIFFGIVLGSHGLDKIQGKLNKHL